MYKALLSVCVVVAVVVSIEAKGGNGKGKGLNKIFGKNPKKCFQEFDATSIIRAELDKLEEAFNNNQLDDFNDISDTAVVMTRGSPTVFGQEAIEITRERRQFARDNIADTLSINIHEAVQISCDRIYHYETASVFKDGNFILSSRWLIIWKKVDGRWLSDVVMTNLPN